MRELKVLLLTRYDKLGASSRLRFLDFAPGLRAKGLSISVKPFFDDRYLRTLYAQKRSSLWILIYYYIRRPVALFSIRRYDLVWLEKEALPWLPAFVETFFLKSRPFVIDFDDAWFRRYDHHPCRLVRWLLGNKFPALIKQAQTVIVGNEFLHRWAKDNGAKAIVQIPTTVNLQRYNGNASPEPRRFRIGWIGSPSSAKYLLSVADALKQFTATIDAEIVLVGSGPLYIPGLSPLILPWREESEIEAIRQFDVGIMPLTNDGWSEGKCAYKLIQYMAAGLPVIASPIGMNCEVVQHGVNGFLAATTQEWVDAFMTLYHDAGLRSRLGHEGRKIVEERYSSMIILPLLAETLSRTVASETAAA